MTDMNDILKAALIVGGATLVISGLERYLDERDEPPAQNGYRPQKEVVFLERIDGDYIGGWVEERQRTYGDGIVCILANVTDKMAKVLLMDDVPKELDRDSHLLLSAIDKKQKLPKLTCLINFGQMDSHLAELMGRQEFVLITK